MKKFNEWREESDQFDDSGLLVQKLSELIRQLKIELENFNGERFEGFLNLIGGIHSLQRSLSEIIHNNPGLLEVRKMQKIKEKEIVSKGVRKTKNDLSSDYKGHIKMNGDVEPFKIL